MKKLLLALALGLVLVLALATTALADNGPHGGFTNTTADCAGCHRMHTATGVSYLLVASDVYSLCTSCHDGTGAYTNVVGGYYTGALWNTTDHGPDPAYSPAQGSTNYPLFGGGFVATRAMYEYSGNNYYNSAAALPLGKAVSSTHEVDGMLGYATPTMIWGAGDLNTGTGRAWAANPDFATAPELECTSCHDPHGNAGRTGGVSTGNPAPSYRLLRFEPHGSGGFEVNLATASAQTGTSWVVAGVSEAGATGGVYIADDGTYWYTPNSDFNLDLSVKSYRARQVGNPYSTYIQGPGDSAGRIYTYQRPAFVPNGTEYSCPATGTDTPVVQGDTSCAYANSATPGPLFNYNAELQNMSRWCATCHDRYFAASGARSTPSGDALFMYRHTNSSSSFGGCASCHAAHGTSADLSTGYAVSGDLDPTSNSSVLLKYTNRGVCLDCHATSINFYTSGLIYRVP